MPAKKAEGKRHVIPARKEWRTRWQRWAGAARYARRIPFAPAERAEQCAGIREGHLRSRTGRMETFFATFRSLLPKMRTVSPEWRRSTTRVSRFRFKNVLNLCKPNPFSLHTVQVCDSAGGAQALITFGTAWLCSTQCQALTRTR
jgi:hypothetical protein